MTLRPVFGASAQKPVSQLLRRGTDAPDARHGCARPRGTRRAPTVVTGGDAPSPGRLPPAYSFSPAPTAASPKNLTEIGVKFTDLVATFREREADRVAVGVHSLSELLMYSNTEHVFQFLRIMGAECRDLGWPLVAVVDDTAVDEQAVATLSQPFETVVSTRVADDQSREYAVTTDDEPTWTAF